MRIPTTLLAGYLGSGKTTVINSFLAKVQDRHVAVLVNDFGAVNIDASLIRSQTDQAISLTNGCVCCSIADDLGGAIDAQVDRADPPEHILIEASGVAEPGRIAQHIGGWPGIELEAVVGVADAETVRARTQDKFVGSLVTRQLRAADLLVLNKLDLVDQPSRAALRQWLETLSPQIRVLETTYGDISPDVLVGPGLRDARRPAPAAPDEGHGPHLSTAVWAPTHDVDLSALEGVLRRLPESIHRLKGFVRDRAGKERLLVQLVGRRLSITPAEFADGEGNNVVDQLVIIGTCGEDVLRSVCAALEGCVPGGAPR